MTTRGLIIISMLVALRNSRIEKIIPLPAPASFQIKQAARDRKT